MRQGCEPNDEKSEREMKAEEDPKRKVERTRDDASGITKGEGAKWKLKRTRNERRETQGEKDNRITKSRIPGFCTFLTRRADVADVKTDVSRCGPTCRCGEKPM